MKVGSYVATIGSMEEQRRLDVIANNIANSNNPGFKKDSVYFSKLMGSSTYTSFDQGPLRDTGNKLDVALSGKGFLRVQGDKGTLYTRAGNLTLDKSKRLVTQDGWPVLGKNGPITVNNPTDVSIDENGQVFDGTAQVDTLDLVQFADSAGMKKLQGGYFEPAQGDNPVKAENCTVRQGALEGANFNPVEEMVHMVESSRNFEAYQKMMQTLDRDLDGQLISRLTA